MRFYLPKYDEKSVDAIAARKFIDEKYNTRTRNKFKFQQVVEKDNKLWYVRQIDPYHDSCLFTPRIRKEAIDLHVRCKTRTLHRYGAPTCFYPTVFDVVLQLPEWVTERDSIYAFSVEIPDSYINDMTDIEVEAFNSGFHVGYTTFYGRNGC